MKSFVPLLLLMVLSGCLNECHSWSEYFKPSQSDVGQSSYAVRTYEGKKTAKTPFILDDDRWQPLGNDEYLRKEELTAKKFSTKEAPSCARNKVYCKKDAEYDDNVKDMFNRALNKAHINLQDLGIMSKMFVDPIAPPSTRYHDDKFSENAVCPARDEVIYPMRGQTKDKEWVFVLNQDNFEQGIKISTCVNLTSIARYSSGGGELKCSTRLEDSSESLCRQNYAYRNVMAMDKQGTNIIKEEVLFPSCCVCKARNKLGRKRNNNFLTSDRRNKEERYRQYGSSNLRKIWN